MRIGNMLPEFVVPEFQRNSLESIAMRLPATDFVTALSVWRISCHSEFTGQNLLGWLILAAVVCTDAFLVSNVGGCLFLKLCGFVEAQRAEIRDVSENHLQLRIGGSPLRSLLTTSVCPVDLEIRFSLAEEASHNPQARIEVTIRDKRWLGSEDRFEMAARRVLWQLRYHLMAV